MKCPHKSCAFFTNCRIKDLAENCSSARDMFTALHRQKIVKEKLVRLKHIILEMRNIATNIIENVQSNDFITCNDIIKHTNAIDHIINQLKIKKNN